MSLYIDVDTVTAVLLADGWHGVADASFNLDSYEYLWSGEDGVQISEMDSSRDPVLLLGGGREDLVPATGFDFVDEATGDRFSGPLTSVLAIQRSTS